MCNSTRFAEWKINGNDSVRRDGIEKLLTYLYRIRYSPRCGHKQRPCHVCC